MAGDGLVRPLNAPAGQPPAYGTQPGTTQPVIVATKVIIIGPNGELLVYNPTVALNNLVASVTGTAKTDAGNSVLPGLTGYSKAGGNYFATQVGGGTASNIIFSEASTEAGPWTTEGFIVCDSAGMTIDSSGAITLQPGGSAGAADQVLSSGLSGGIPATQLDRTALSVGNSVTATDLTTAWTIPAHDGDNGARYMLETFITATTGATAAETLTIGLDLNAGTLIPLATLGASFNGSALSTTYDIPVRLSVVPGAGATAADAQISLSAMVGDTSANRLATNSAVMTGHSNTTAWDTTTVKTVAVYAVWGGTGGTGQSASAQWSEFTRSGQN